MSDPNTDPSDPNEQDAANPSNPQPGEPAGTDTGGNAGGTGEQAPDFRERYLRLYADFENFKKRASREREESRRAVTESIVTRLLPVLDNFEMALQAADQPGVGIDTLREGVRMIHSQLRGSFADLGVEEIDARGQPFDPAFHEAMSQMESAEVPDGHVLHQARKGYRLRERLLRPASVVVARPPASAPGESAGESDEPSR